MGLTKEIVLEFMRRRQELKKIQEEEKLRFEEYQKNNAALMLEKEGAQKDVDVMKETITVHARKDFEETGEKKLLGGIGIRVGTTMDYDAEKAFGWALHHKLCLALDKREFEKIAKTQDIEFVKKEEKVVVTFPKALIVGGEKE